MPNRGVLFLAFDNLVFSTMTLMSVVSMRLSGVSEPIAIMTNLPQQLWHDRKLLNYDLLFPTSGFHSGLRRVATLKATIMDYTPFHETLLVDSDVLFLRPIDDIWDDWSDLAVAIDACQTIQIVRGVEPGWGTAEGWARTMELVGEKAAHYNVGVMKVRQRDAVNAFFRRWNFEINRLSVPDLDQAAFIRALHESKIKFRTLEERFNASQRRFHQAQVKVESPAILHFNGINNAIRLDLMGRIFERNFGSQLLSS